jgi:hypothetical protein
MKRSLQTSLAFALLLLGLSHADSFAYQKVKKRVQIVGVTGTYKYVLNTVEVLELPDHRVRISFSGFWPNDHKRVETRNVGNFDETVPLKGRTAVVKPRYGDKDCAITLEFRAGKVTITEEGYHCGFGFNVEADGTYRKVSSKPPDLPTVEPEHISSQGRQ